MKYSQCMLVAEFLKGLTSQTRVKILCYLGDKEKSVNEICDGIDEKQSYVSQQLKILYQKSYLKKKKIGTKVLYSIKNKRILEIFSDVVKYLDN
ncbi:winged helix-turn-helix transcriptional regulator [bacterium]|nr:winged helix-turn-helix transcriptional regulator [bacterium]